METAGLTELTNRVNGARRRTGAEQRRRELNRSCHRLLIPAVVFPVVGGAVTNPVQTALLGPEEGQFWDVRRISITGLTANPAASELLPSNPAAATDFIYTNNTGAPVNFSALKFVFTTDATVGNRALAVQIKDAAGNLLAQNTNLASVTASSSLTTSLYVGSPNIWNSASGGVQGALPNIAIPAGGTLTIHLSGTVGAADQISAIVGTFAAVAQTVSVYREINTPTAGNPQNFLHTFTASLPDWEPGGGLLMESPEGLLLAGTGLTTASLTFNAEGVQVEVAHEAEYLF